MFLMMKLQSLVARLLFWGFLLSFIGFSEALLAVEGQNDPFFLSVKSAMQHNPRVLAAVAQLKAAQEKEPQSRALLLPAIDLTASKSHNRTEWSGGQATTDPYALGVTLTQSLFSQKALVGLRTVRPYIAAAEHDLQAVIQNVFLETAGVIVDLLQSTEVVRLAKNNRELLQHHLSATQSRFDVGEITRTDVSQAQSRLASSEAIVVRSENVLAVGRSRFMELTGQRVPDGLQLPKFRSGIMTADLAKLQARIDARPELVAAKLRLQLALEEVEMARAGHYPTVALTAKAARSWGEEVTSANELSRYGVDLGLTLPLYSGGMVVSQTAETLARKEAQEAEVDRLRRLMTREVEAALLDLESAKAVDAALQTALKAANDALDGVEREYHVGTRNALDLLDAQNEAFSAQTELAKSHFGIVLSQFRLLYSMGQLTLDAVTVATGQSKHK